MTIGSLTQNTRYYLRLYPQDKHGKLSTTYRSINFWTNRKPLPPTLTNPSQNTQFPIGIVERDVRVDGERSRTRCPAQSAFRLRWRSAGAPGTPAGPWSTVIESVTSFDVVRTRADDLEDEHLLRVDRRHPGPAGPVVGLLVPEPASYLNGNTTAPASDLPGHGGVAVQVDTDLSFQWKFRDATVAATQVSADLRYRVKGTADWFTLIGTADTVVGGVVTVAGVPGPNPALVEPRRVPAGPALRVAGPDLRHGRRWCPTGPTRRTSGQSPRPGPRSPSPTPPRDRRPAPPLGCGDNRVFVYDRGGMNAAWRDHPAGVGAVGPEA